MFAELNLNLEKLINDYVEIVPMKIKLTKNNMKNTLIIIGVISSTLLFILNFYMCIQYNAPFFYVALASLSL